MKTLFLGAVEGSKVALQALIAADLKPTAVLTLPPEAAGRHSDFADIGSPARAHGIEVLHTMNVNAPETLAAVERLKPDLCLVIGWSQICKAPFRTIARLGNIGFHPAALPAFRGRAVIPWTILMGLEETGSTLFWLDDGIDSGDIVLQRRFAVDEEETARGLYDKHLAALSEMLPEAVRMAAGGTAPRIAQDHALATYCAKRTPEDGLIDWRADARDIVRLVRAVGDPYPGAFTLYGGERFWIDEAHLPDRPERYIGLAGQVQEHDGDGFIVCCGDGRSILVTKWHSKSGLKPRRHGKFGEGLV